MAVKRIYVAGHRGMVGSAIVRQLEARGDCEIVTRTHAELDLVDQAAVRAFFADTQLDEVYVAAAHVGGIHANNTYPADFIYDNLMIECNLIQAAHRAGVQKLLCLGSSCIYPRNAEQPMREDALLTGVLEATNGCQDRWHQALRKLQSPAWARLPQRDAHQSVRAER
jgi:GDP-L-fucose synthase